MAQTQENATTAEKLLEVAGEIFALKGIGATVREICTAAGCSVAAINYHFGDKQQLYIRCVRLACEHKQRLFPVPTVDSLPDGDDDESVRARGEVLRQFLRVVLRRVAAEPEYSWQDTLALREIMNPTPEVEQEMGKAMKPDFESLNRLLSSMLGVHDRLELRQTLAIQIMSQAMFFKTGRGMRRVFRLNTECLEDPQSYADLICDSILRQITALASTSLADGMSADI